MMQSLSNFAKKTPFEFPELTDVALKLKNVAGIGDKELIPMLTNLGDIASSQGKGISQIVEAYNDAITGEYERLKEFGDARLGSLKFHLFSDEPVYEDLDTLKLAEALTYLANSYGADRDLVKKVLAGNDGIC